MNYEQIAFGITDKMIKQALVPLNSVSIGGSSYSNLNTPNNMLGSSFSGGTPSLTNTGTSAPTIYPPSTGSQPKLPTKAPASKSKLTPPPRPVSVLRTNPDTGEQYYVKQLPSGGHMVVSPSGYGVDYQTAQNNNAQYGTYFPQQNPAQAAVGSATSNVRAYDPNVGFDNYFQNVKQRAGTGVSDQYIYRAIAQNGPIGMREAARQRQDATQATPGGVPAVTGVGNTDNTSRSLPSYSTASTFERGWLSQPVGSTQQPQEPTFNPDTTPGWGLWTPQQIREYAITDEKELSPEEFAKRNSPAFRTQLIKNKIEQDRRSKARSMTYSGDYNEVTGQPTNQQSFDDAAAKWDDTYKAVESTIRTPYFVSKWREKGFTDEQIDDWVRRQTTKRMEKDYGKRPAMRPAMTPGVTEVAASDGSTPFDPGVPTLEPVYEPGKVTDYRFPDHEDSLYSAVRKKQGSSNIIPLLFNEKASSIAKRLLNGNDFTGR